MSSTSDLTINASKFALSNVAEDTKKLHVLLAKVTEAGPHWYEVGAARYRDMREIGETPFPIPVYLPEAKDASVPSREKGREIPIRVYTPDNGEPSRGILLHFHGGGFVIGTQKHSDSNLKKWANECQLTAISVGYRLAPEDPHPAAVEDCFDTVEYLVDQGKAVYNGELRFLVGESAGATLAVQSAFHLLRSRPQHQLSGIVAPYGYFDLTNNLPQSSTFDKPLFLNHEALNRFKDVYVPGKDISERRNPLISPLYENLQALTQGGKTLPPAIFLCGTEDPLLDDTILMGTKWLMTGSEAVVKIYPGGPHGFLAFAGIKNADEGAAAIISFLQEKLA